MHHPILLRGFSDEFVEYFFRLPAVLQQNILHPEDDDQFGLWIDHPVRCESAAVPERRLAETG